MKPRNEYEKIILDEAQRIKDREEFIDQKVNEIKEKRLTRTDKFLRWWDNKLIPAVWIGGAVFLLLYEFGAFGKKL